MPGVGHGKRRPKIHKVVSGDTLGDVAAIHGCTLQAVRTANGLKGDRIFVGQALTVPRGCKGKKRPYAKEGRPAIVRHEVIPGETLGAIAERYGTRVAAVARRNRLKGHIIYPGQVLKVRAKIPSRDRRMFIYTIVKGDTLERIGKRFGMGWPEIRRMNPGIDPRRMRIGDRLKLWRDGPEQRSETVGRPQAGSLVHGEQLPAGPGYYRRRTKRAYGTNETITRLLKVIATVRKRHPKVHDLAIGDISYKKGGEISGHVSHQSGRDVDIGMFFEKYPRPRPKGFLRADRHALDFAATWTLLTALTGRSKKDAHVEYIFLDYDVQKQIYEWAKRNRKGKKQLSWMFQYPRGKKGHGALIRHEPNHADHLHVRFRCPAKNPKCR